MKKPAPLLRETQPLPPLDLSEMRVAVGARVRHFNGILGRWSPAVSFVMVGRNEAELGAAILNILPPNKPFPPRKSYQRVMIVPLPVATLHRQTKRLITALPPKGKQRSSPTRRKGCPADKGLKDGARSSNGGVEAKFPQTWGKIR